MQYFSGKKSLQVAPLNQYYVWELNLVQKESKVIHKKYTHLDKQQKNYYKNFVKQTEK